MKPGVRINDPAVCSNERSARTDRRRAGAAVLELALTLGVLLTLTFGSVEFGHFFYLKNTMQGAAREGARAAIPPATSNTDVTAAVNASLVAAGLNPAQFTTEVRVNGTVANASTAATGQRIEVRVSATWGTVGLRPLGVLSTTKTVRGAATMRREG
jgi:Flp pilus assembly protein TadG